MAGLTVALRMYLRQNCLPVKGWGRRCERWGHDHFNEISTYISWIRGSTAGICPACEISPAHDGWPVASVSYSTVIMLGVCTLVSAGHVIMFKLQADRYKQNLEILV